MAGRKARSVYNDPRWKKVRLKALERARWRCERCQYPGRLEVHHIVSIYDNILLAFVLANLEVLCRTCHILHHKTENEEKKPIDQRIPEPWLDFVNELA